MTTSILSLNSPLNKLGLDISPLTTEVLLIIFSTISGSKKKANCFLNLSSEDRLFLSLTKQNTLSTLSLYTSSFKICTPKKPVTPVSKTFPIWSYNLTSSPL